MSGGILVLAYSVLDSDVGVTSIERDDRLGELLGVPGVCRSRVAIGVSSRGVPLKASFNESTEATTLPAILRRR